jgi:hypothetical protein
VFLVYDGFDMDIDPVIIYERIKTIPNHDEVLKSTLALLVPFLFATVVKTTKNTSQLGYLIGFSLPNPQPLQTVGRRAVLSKSSQH